MNASPAPSSTSAPSRPRMSIRPEITYPMWDRESAGDRSIVPRPSPAGLIDAAADRDVLELDRTVGAAIEERPHTVGRTNILRLDAWSIEGSIQAPAVSTPAASSDRKGPRRPEDGSP
jgi:hypothetical protein